MACGLQATATVWGYVQTFLKRIENPWLKTRSICTTTASNPFLKLFKNRFLDQIARSMIEDFKAGRAKELKKGSKRSSCRRLR